MALWDLVWAGLLTNDTLAPLRTVLGTGRPVATDPAAGRASTVGPAGRRHLPPARIRTRRHAVAHWAANRQRTVVRPAASRR